MKGNGLERPANKKIEEAADEYADLRDQRMAVLAKEIAAKEKLLFIMHQHKLTTYKYDGRIVELLPTEKVKVRDEDDESDD